MAKPQASPIPSRHDVKSATTIEPLSLQEEFVRTPGDIAYWAGQYSDALDAQLTAKAERERVEAETYLRIKRDAVEDGGKITEKAVGSLLEADPAYRAAVAAEVKAEVAKSRVTGVLEAVRAKKDVLISLGAHMRHEDEIRILKERSKNR